MSMNTKESLSELLKANSSEFIPTANPDVTLTDYNSNTEFSVPVTSIYGYSQKARSTYVFFVATPFKPVVELAYQVKQKLDNAVLDCPYLVPIEAIDIRGVKSTVYINVYDLSGIEENKDADSNGELLIFRKSTRRPIWTIEPLDSLVKRLVNAKADHQLSVLLAAKYKQAQ